MTREAAKYIVSFFVMLLAFYVFDFTRTTAYGDGALLVILLDVVLAIVAMRLIWRSEGSRDLERRVAALEQAMGKPKRASRVERVMNSLDESELAELRSRLSDDGEQIPLETLLQRDDERRQRP